LKGPRRALRMGLSFKREKIFAHSQMQKWQIFRKRPILSGIVGDGAKFWALACREDLDSCFWRCDEMRNTFYSCPQEPEIHAKGNIFFQAKDNLR
jgi:hypothetical protein